MMIDLGTGNNNKINWALKNKQEFIDIVETVYQRARKGSGLPLKIIPRSMATEFLYVIPLVWSCCILHTSTTGDLKIVVSRWI